MTSPTVICRPFALCAALIAITSSTQALSRFRRFGAFVPFGFGRLMGRLALCEESHSSHIGRLRPRAPIGMRDAAERER
jgi:hypothetical protein